MEGWDEKYGGLRMYKKTFREQNKGPLSASKDDFPAL